MQGGKIAVKSTPGQGSRFTCRFANCLLDETPAEPELPIAREQSRQCDRPGGKRSILIVEDNAVNMKLARNVLRSRGYRIIEATTGEEALELLRGELPDLVLMDIQLPGMDGLEVTRRIKEDPATAGLPVVALTAHAQKADEPAGAGCGLRRATSPSRSGWPSSRARSSPSSCPGEQVA